MSLLVDRASVTLSRAMDVRLARQNVLSGNLANIDTPGFVARDINFEDAMTEFSTEDDSQANIRFGEMRISETPSPENYGTGLDANQVSLDQTMAKFAENGMQYSASAKTIAKKMAILRYAASDGAA